MLLIFQIGIGHLVVFINKADAADQEVLELVGHSFFTFWNAVESEWYFIQWWVIYKFHFLN